MCTCQTETTPTLSSPETPTSSSASAGSDRYAFADHFGSQLDKSIHRIEQAIIADDQAERARRWLATSPHAQNLRDQKVIDLVERAKSMAAHPAGTTARFVAATHGVTVDLDDSPDPDDFELAVHEAAENMAKAVLEARRKLVREVREGLTKYLDGVGR